MTQQVNDIHAAFRRKNESIEVQAGAGTGKTTLIVSGNHYLPHSTLFLAFNSAIAKELGERMPHRQDQCKTFHAICLRILTQRVGRLKVDNYKYQNLAKKEGMSEDKAYMVRDIIECFQLSADAAMSQVADWTPQFIRAVCPEVNYYELEIPADCELEVLDCASILLQREAKKLTAYTFSDMLFFVAHYAHHKKWWLTDYDCVVVDESQDVSPIRLSIVKRLTKRVIHVGDTRQSIYMFAGAMSDAMTELTATFQCKQYPLSTTWRCARKIVEEAERIIGPFLQARPDAPDGIVDQITNAQFVNSYLDADCMVICRTNAPLLNTAFSLFRANTEFNIKSDFPERLAKRAKRLAEGCKGMAAYRTAILEWRDNKLDGCKSDLLKERITDEADCLLLLCDRVERPMDAHSLLLQLMRSTRGVTLTTGHKAKGLEANSVFIIRPDLVPAPWIDPDMKPLQYQQELNLHYVMVTRAKNNLFYVIPEEKK